MDRPVENQKVLIFVRKNSIFVAYLFDNGEKSFLVGTVKIIVICVVYRHWVVHETNSKISKGNVLA